MRSDTLRRAPAGGPLNPAPNPRLRARRRLRRRLPNPLAAAALALFLIFFALPVLWLALAATKTDQQLVQDNPLSFGPGTRCGRTGTR